MKDLTKNRFKALGITQAQFCEQHGFNNSNFHLTYKKLGKNLKEIERFLEKLGLKIQIEPVGNIDRI